MPNGAVAIFPKALLRYSRTHPNNNNVEPQTVLGLPARHSIHTSPPRNGLMIAHYIALGPTLMGL